MKENTRRQFLKNSSLTALSLACASKLSGYSKKSKSDLNCEATTLDYYGEGPFYTEDPPILNDNKLATDSAVGQRMIISGRVINLDCSQYIPNTKIDIWHADNEGAYDNEGYNFRGVVYSNDQGFYLFETILPGKYLNGSKFRPSHIHFKITPPEFPEMITQLYFEGDTDIDGDAAASIDSGTYDASSRIIGLTENTDGVLEGNWDIVVDGEGIISSNDIHLNKGIIYQVSPNPGTSKFEINYGVFKSSMINLSIYDINGIQVAELEERKLGAGKYTAEWQSDSSMPRGHYFAVLKVNNLQIHHLKILLTH